MKESAELAFQYGPFFFSLLFLVSISRWAFRNYNAACRRTNPAPDAKEISTLKNTYVASFLVGTVLVLASVVWWFLYRPQRFIFEGEIDSLEQYDILLSGSEKIFFRSTYQQAPFYRRLSQTAYFVIVGDKPFSPGDGYDFDLYKGTISEAKITQDRNRLHVDYDPDDPSPTYTLDCCDDSGHYQLKKTSKAKSTKAVRITGVVYAAPPQQEADPGISPTPLTEKELRRLHVRPDKSRPVSGPGSVLRNPLAEIGERSLALQQLQLMDRKAFIQVLDQSLGDGSDDPLVLSILDLTRHSDKQLAFRATKLLDALNVKQYVAELLAPTQGATRPRWAGWAKDLGTQLPAMRVLFRVDKATAKAILEIAKERGFASPPLEQDIDAGQKTRVLVPTWLPSESYHRAGDWYFVKATWNPDDDHVRSCLTNLFHTELISSRTPEQEGDLMRQKRGVRYVYWDEDWALSIAASIQRCGGGFSFVHPGQ